MSQPDPIAPKSQSPSFPGLDAFFPQRAPRAVNLSLAGHLLLLAWLLHSPNPIYIKPSSVMHGDGGKAMTEIYWPNPSAATQDELVATRPRLTLPKVSDQQKRREEEHAKLAEEALEARRARQEPMAGTAFGSLSYGETTGQEVRPALRVFGSEPHVDRDELNGAVGNVIIELTIDEQGNIVSRTVLQSMGPMIDNRVLAALNNWRFKPATRDGVPIPSKQDVYYHFPPLR